MTDEPQPKKPPRKRTQFGRRSQFPRKESLAVQQRKAAAWIEFMKPDPKSTKGNP